MFNKLAWKKMRQCSRQIKKGVKRTRVKLDKRATVQRGCSAVKDDVGKENAKRILKLHQEFRF